MFRFRPSLFFGCRSTIVVWVVGGVACREPASKELAEDCLETTWYRDVDGDGVGDGAGPYSACVAPAGHVALDGDCNDQDPTVKPGAVEVCNGIDDDCNGSVDDGADGEGRLVYTDADGDGYGDPATEHLACVASGGESVVGGDCDDANPTVFPGGEDTPRDGVDGDCDGADALSAAERPYRGDVTWLSSEDIAAFCAEYDAVVGDVSIAGGGFVGAVEVDCLVEVAGDLTISADMLSSLSFPQLWWVEGELRVAGNPTLASWSVPSLRFVDGDLVWLDNDSLPIPVFSDLEGVGTLARLSGGTFPVLTVVTQDVGLTDGLMLNALTRVGGRISIADGVLDAVSLPRLVEAGELDLRSARVDAVSLDQLEEVDSLIFELAAMSSPLLLPALTNVYGDGRFLATHEEIVLPRLQHVSGVLEANPAGLTSFEAPDLIDVLGDVSVGGEDTAWVRLDALSNVAGTLQVQCPGCDGIRLGALETVEQSLVLVGGTDTSELNLLLLSGVGGALTIDGFSTLRQLDLPALASVTGPVSLEGLDWVESVDLGALAYPGDVVNIVGLPSLTLVDLSSLQLGAVRGGLVVAENPILETLHFGSWGAEAGSLTLVNNPALVAVNLTGLSTVGGLSLQGPLEAVDLSALTATTGPMILHLDDVPSLDLGLLTRVGGDFVLTGAYTNLELQTLSVVGGAFQLSVNGTADLSMPMLSRVFGDFLMVPTQSSQLDLTNLQEVGGVLGVSYAENLSTLDLPALSSLGGLLLDSNTVLSDIQMTNVSSTTSGIAIYQNVALENINGLSGVVSIQGALDIVGNPVLSDIMGLGNVTSIGSDVRIHSNVVLPAAQVDALIFDTIGAANIAGTIQIRDNGP